MRKTVYCLMLMALMAGFTACSSSDDVQDVLNDIDDEMAVASSLNRKQKLTSL